MKHLERHSGFSMVELVVALSLAAILGVAGFKIISMNQRQDTQTSIRGEMEAGLAQLSTQIVETGALAGDSATAGCTAPSATSLICTLFRAGAAGGQRVQFILNGTSLLYQTEVSGAWVTKTTYPNISRFVVCDQAAMQASTCAITPNNISVVYRARAPQNARFFRFQIESAATEGTVTRAGHTNQDIRISLQGSFYVRNPSPFGPTVNYVIGSPI